MTSTRKPILIIGAGLGGLTLARTLLKNHVPFRIFERDIPQAMRTQGWAISLHDAMMKDLSVAFAQDVSDLRSLSPSAPVDLPSEGVIYSLENGERKKLFQFGESQAQSFVRAQRAKLRNWLMTGVKVEWGKKFTHFEQKSDSVLAYFEDGTAAEGAILVGADGISSRVRRQLLPEAGQPKRLPIGIVVGEVEVEQETYQRWLKLGTSFTVGFSDSRRLFVGLKEISEDKVKASFYWMFGWADEEAVNPEYWTTNASQQQLHDFVQSHLDNLDAEYIEPFRATPVSGILHPPLQMRDMVPPPIPSGLITLLGDAVHPMVPFRGEGGNMAMKDAMVLGEQLASVDEKSALQDVLKVYEVEMTDRAGKSVIKSRESTFMHAGIFDKK